METSAVFEKKQYNILRTNLKETKNKLSDKKETLLERQIA
jgi:5-bromo-4-chloroindolyl phosphate hydrolysis protein